MWLNKCTRENLSKSLTVGWWCGRIRSMTRQPSCSLFLFTHVRLGSRFWPHSSHTYAGVWVREGRKKSKDWLGIHLLLIFSLHIFFQSKVLYTFYFNINRIHISECLKNQTPHFFTRKLKLRKGKWLVQGCPSSWWQGHKPQEQET